MSNLTEQFEAIEEHWATIYENCLSSPSQAEPHLNGSSIDDINEIMKTIGHWIRRVSRPRRPSGAYKIANSLLTTTVSLFMPQ